MARFQSSFFHRYEAQIMWGTLIFLLALIIKTIAYLWFFSYIGDGFYLTQHSQQTTWFRSLLLAPNPVSIQAYDDVWFHYISYVDAFVNGWNPYTDTGLSSDSITGYYNYGPLYLVMISWGALLFGLSPYESIVVSNLMFDAVNCSLLYFIAHRYMSRTRALLVTSLYAFSPVMLFYIDFKMLNQPQMTFFCLLVLLAWLHDRHSLVWIFLAAGFMTKFIPIFLGIPLILYYYLRFGRVDLVKYLSIFALYSIAFLLPFFLDSPGPVLDQFTDIATRGNTGFIDNFVPNLPLLFATAGLVIIFYYGRESFVNDKILVLRAVIYYILAVHDGFYPLWSRGFKYYHGFLMAFYLLLVFVTHRHTRLKLVSSLFLTYILNVLIFVLPINIGIFHHRRVFWLYLPFLIFIWLLWDIRNLRRINNQVLAVDESV